LAGATVDTRELCFDPRAVQELIDSKPWLQALVLSRVANRKTASIPDRVEDMLLLDTL
jgi:hypothetical protein|tara:strand:- start:19289 stop:19462 length:174 start_codon:yes stop_codon:yes gene_type:complete